MKTLVVYSRSSTQRPRSVLASLCDWLVSEDHDVEVVDVSDFSFVNQDLPPRWFARLMGHNTSPERLDEVLDSLNVRRTLLSPGKSSFDPLPDVVNAELEDAIWSDLVTYFRTDQVDTKRLLVRSVSKTMRSLSTALYWQLCDFLQSSDYDQVYVPNGRVPEQRMALEACREKGLGICYYEIGRAKPHSFYAGLTQVHDRIGTQHEIDSVLAKTSTQEIKKAATQWLEERTKGNSSINVYSETWKETSRRTSTSRGNQQRAVLFSSSVDEFASYGKTWELHSWKDQYEAFDAIIALLEAKGVDCTLRVHPNLTNKSLQYFVDEIGRINELSGAHPGLSVVWHNEPVNSYGLVAESDYVIVGRSTLGLEASLMEKCVWITTAARYDMVADVRKALCPSDVTEKNFSLWKANPYGAERFVAYWTTLDHKFTYGEKNWSTWDSFRAPQKLRWGQLLVKNRLVHIMLMVRMEITRLRNQRFRPREKAKTRNTFGSQPSRRTP